MRRLIGFALLILLSACSAKQDMASAEAAIARFHAELNAGQFDQIFAESSAEWQKASPKADTVQLFTAVRNKLGRFISGRQDGWRVNYGTGGNTIFVQYQSKFQKGDAVETFTLRQDGNAAQLIGYNINSRALITG